MNILHRIYHDYCMPGRWDEYEKILHYALNQGYQFARIRDHESYRNDKVFYLRHDIDSDIPLAKKMFSIEKNLESKAPIISEMQQLIQAS